MPGSGTRSRASIILAGANYFGLLVERDWFPIPEELPIVGAGIWVAHNGSGPHPLAVCGRIAGWSLATAYYMAWVDISDRSF